MIIAGVRLIDVHRLG